MITEILLRTYSSKYELMEKFKNAILDNTNLSVKLIDHSNLSIEDFEHTEQETLISVDEFISKKLDIPYYRMSRVFNNHGDVIGKYEQGIITETGNNVRVLDSDMVRGDTIQRACTTFKTTKFFVPLVVRSYQDLIDVEDIVENKSIILVEDQLKLINLYNINLARFAYSYLHNKEFFCKRTSLPEHMYDIFHDIKNEHENYY